MFDQLKTLRLYDLRYTLAAPLLARLVLRTAREHSQSGPLRLSRGLGNHRTGDGGAALRLHPG